jgi:ATP-dependent RNA helicase RhlE
MTFKDLNLNNPLLNALEDLGLTIPTAIQEKVFSVVMSGKDVCGIAQTGTGKTFAYLLPCLRQFMFTKEKHPQIIVLVPTRELVVQVVEEAKKLTAYMSVRIVGIYGGVNFKPQAAEVSQGVDLLVATPGRIIDLLSAGVLSAKSIKKLVIDEFDEMLNLGFRPQLINIFDKLPEKRQNLLFSATLNDEVEGLMDTFFNHPERVEATPVGTPLDNISQTRFDVPNFYTKINLLKTLLDNDPSMNKVLVFVSTKHLADQLFAELESDFQDKVDVIHSNKTQLNRFEAVSVLIATDVIARGIDVASVSHVFNFDLPEIPQNYVHRIGRTGRADKRGVAISFVTEAEKERLKLIEALMNYQIETLPLPNDLEISTKQLPEEIPEVKMKIIKMKVGDKPGPAFHEKSEKNSKVNVRRDHEAEKKRKYGKSYEKRRRND